MSVLYIVGRPGRPIAGWHNMAHLMQTGIPEINENNDSQPNIVPIEIWAAKVLAKGREELWQARFEKQRLVLDLPLRKW